MANVGCCVTAMALALKLARIDNIVAPVLYPLDPGSLNGFMSNTLSVPGGQFDGDGDMLPWDTVARVRANTGKALVFDSSGGDIDSNQNERAAFDALDKALCTNHLPMIVGVRSCNSGRYPGHYVLVTGKQNNPDGSPRYLISDPGCGMTSLEDYANKFVTRGFVKDPAGDLSQFSLAVGENADLLVVDANGRRTGFDSATGNILREIPESVHFVDALDDDLAGGPVTGTTHSIHVSKPGQGAYQVIVTGLNSGPYTLSVRAYSQDGSPEPAVVLNGIAGVGSGSSFQIRFVSTPGATSRVVRVATS